MPFAPDRLPGRVPRRSAASARACRCARRCRTSARSCWPRCSAPTRRRSRRLGLVFHYADAKGLPLLDLADLRALLTFLDSDAGKAELEGIGGLSSATVGVLLRALVGARGRRRQRVLRRAAARRSPTCCAPRPTGAAIISCLELPAVQDKPALFSTALMWLLAELFETLPEAGDLPKPKLVFFFDEAHLLFDGATEAFVDVGRADGAPDPLQGRRRLLRHPDARRTCPVDVLGQLGNRVQHALRAFTPDDAKALQGDRLDVPEVRLLRPRGAAARARASARRR